MTRCLYLHGFASGPRSSKGVAFEEHFGTRGLTVERLNLRVPSLAHLRLSQMIDSVLARIDGPTVLVGSSLGGLTAARVAARSSEVRAVVLMAPAFQLVARWRERLGPDGWDAWRTSGWLDIHDYAERQPARVDFGFAEDALRTDDGLPVVTVPTLVFHGVRDDTVDVASSRAWVAATPSATLVELDDGHELVASLPAILPRAWDFLAPYSPSQ